MKPFWLFVLAFSVLGCKKTIVDRTPKALLMEHSWYRYQTHYISIDTTHHITLHDTSYQAATCEQQEYFNLLSNDSASAMAVCGMATAHNLPGKWHLDTDSIVSLLCPIPLPVGVPDAYLGFPLSRLTAIDDTHFDVYSFQYLYSLSGGVDITVYFMSYYTTYKAVVK